MPWMDLTLPAMAAVTPGDGKPDAKPESADDVLRKLLRLSEFDMRPVLLYFHYPHGEKSELNSDGRVSKKQCMTMVDEQVSRWSLLYRCYEVDMAVSDKKTAERLGAGKGTSFSVINGKLEVIGRSDAMTTSKAVAQFLRESIETGCATYWTSIQRQIDDQKATLEEARKLAAKKDWKAAKERYDAIRQSDVRVATFWDDVFDEAAKIDTKAKQT